MRILCVNPPYFENFSRGQRSPAVTKSATLYYPLWLSTATGMLLKEGFDARLVDGPGSHLSADEVSAIARDFRPDVVVCETSTPSILNDVEVGVRLKRETCAKLVMVGTHVSALPLESLRLSEEIDAVTLREYDYTLPELCRALAGDVPMKDVKGICWRDRESGTLVANGERELAASLDDLPWASKIYKQFLTYENYFYAITQHPVVAIITGRGCPYRCNFCLFPQTLHGHKYRLRSVDDVADEMVFIQESFEGIAEVFIEDDTLTVDRERCHALAEAFIRKGVRLAWTANSRCDVDQDSLRIMKRAGLRLLCVGIESGTQEILNNVRKGIRLEQIRKFFADARAAEVQVHGCFMAGNVGETKETLEKTLELSIELDPDTVQFFPLMVYPGTSAYAWAEEQGYIRAASWAEWLTDDGMHNCVLERPELTAKDLVSWCDDARRRFYLRPKYIARKAKQAITHPGEGKRLVKSFATFGKHLFRG